MILTIRRVACTFLSGAACMLALPLNASTAVAGDAPNGGGERHAAAQTVVDPELKGAIAAAPKASDWPNSNYARLLDIANITVQSDGTRVRSISPYI